jgi:hypothetical protein
MIKRQLDKRFARLVLKGTKDTTIWDGPWPLGVPIRLFHYGKKSGKTVEIEVGTIIVKSPPMTEEDENRHRRAGADPAQARVDTVLAAINGQNDQGKGRRKGGSDAN